MKKSALLIAFLVIATSAVMASRPDSGKIYRKRKQLLLAGGITAYAGSMTFLYHSWYKNYDQSSFHFINDTHEWMLMDKAGHTLTAYYLSNYSFHAYRWAGYEKNRAVWMAGATGFMYQTVIEVLDGFSAKWGASYGDLAANTLGCLLFASQQNGWQEQRILPKYSYHNTKFPDYRPDLLGNTLAKNLLKDYNAHTYWLSFNIRSLFPDSRSPSWLNVAVGYNGYGMTGGEKNASSYNGKPIPEFTRTARFFLAPDVDFGRIETDSRFLNFLLKGLRFLKAPSPALEYDFSKGLRVKLLYF